MLEPRPHRLRRRFVDRPAPVPDAAEDLRFIRQTLERSSAFTAVSGWGIAGVGATALPAAWLAHRQSAPAIWLAIWLVEAVVAVTLALLTTYFKARRMHVPVTSAPGRRFVLSFLPPAAAAAALTAAMFLAGMSYLLPALWLLLYGASVITAGAFSVPIVPAMGVCFMAAGLLALSASFSWAEALLAIGFGGLHLIFGVWITRRYGG